MFGMLPRRKMRGPGGIVGASMLPRNYMFDMKCDQRRRILWDVAILTRIPGAFSNPFTQTLAHAKRITLRGSGAPWPA